MTVRIYVPKDAAARNKPPRLHLHLGEDAKRAPVTAPFSYGVGWCCMVFLQQITTGHSRNRPHDYKWDNAVIR
jgi:hypothetical protein